MELEWLGLAADRLRLALAAEGVVLMEEAARDAVACIPRCDDWLDVTRWLFWLERARFDRLAAERLSRRLSVRHAIERSPQALLTMLGQTKFDEPSTGLRGKTTVNRLILTTNDTSAGYIKSVRVADRAIPVHRMESLVRGPVPRGDSPAAFFAAREAIAHETLHEWQRSPRMLEAWLDIVADCKDAGRVELWIDPAPNDRLIALRTVAWLAVHPEIVAKLSLAHLGDQLGGRPSGETRTQEPLRAAVDGATLQTAIETWDAYCSPTPEAWDALRQRPLEGWPGLHAIVTRLLRELPSIDSGLTASQRRVLERAAAAGPAATRFFDLSVWSAQVDPERVFDYWDFGALVADLADPVAPLLAGLPSGPFDIGLHLDAERRRAFMGNKLAVTVLGQAILERRDDWTAHLTLDRWWGGTRLTNNELWRWDDQHAALIAPA